MTSTRISRERGVFPYRDAIRRRWVLVLGVALAASVLSFALDSLRGSLYTAEALVKVRELGESGRGETGSERVSEERLAELRTLAGPEKLARSAMDEIGWERGIEEYGRRLAVEDGGRGDLAVEFSGASPRRAEEGADAYARAFVSRMEDMNGNRLAGGSLRVDAEVAREARSLPEPLWSQPLTLGLVALLPGFLLGCALALVAERRARRCWEARDAELALGAPVLGVIPDLGAGEPDAGESEEERVVR